MGIAALVGRRVKPARDLLLGRLERRIDVSGAFAVDHLEIMTRVDHDLHVEGAALEALFFSIEIKEAPALAVIVDA